MVSDAKVKPGDVVRIQNWHGVVLETHFDSRGEISVIQVQTVRNIFRGFGPEYIDIRLNPDAVRLATMADLEKEILTHQRMLDGAIECLLANVPVQHPNQNQPLTGKDRQTDP